MAMTHHSGHSSAPATLFDALPAPASAWRTSEVMLGTQLSKGQLLLSFASYMHAAVARC